VNGYFLCLTSVPGTPIYGAPPSGAIIGYTGNVVAFAGIQSGRWVSVQTDDGLLGYIDGATIKPFQPAYPGQACVVTLGVGQRPIFHIN
jgi:hypothetical protein